MPDLRSDDDKAKDCLDTLEHLKRVRLVYEQMVDNIITYVNHSRRRITDQYYTKGQKTGIEVYDGSALSAVNLCVDGMVGYLCARNLRWFRLTIPGKFNFPRAGGMRAWSGRKISDYPEVRKWLEGVNDVQYDAFARSNFYDMIPEFIRDGATMGTSNAFVEEDVNTGKGVFTVPHFRECYIAEDKYGRVDTWYRVYDVTLKQLVQRFGMDKMKEAAGWEFESKYKDSKYDTMQLLHAVYPRSDYDTQAENGANRPIASIYVLVAKKKLLEEDGYWRMRPVAWRWRKNNDELYGRSPAWDAYIDIQLANQQSRSNLVAAHKMVEPPMVAPDDLRGEVNAGPRGWTFMRGEAMAAQFPRPLVTGINLPFGIDALQRTEKIIKDHFAVDFFLMLTTAMMNKVELTATQVVEMMGEKAAVLGTRVGMLQSEALERFHDLMFEMEVDAGRMPSPPQILLDTYRGRIEVEYLGPLAQAQVHLSKSRAIQAGVALAGQIGQISSPSLDVVDWDKAMIESLDATGFPEGCLRDSREVSAIRQQRAQEMERQKKIEAAPAMAKLMHAASHMPQKAEGGEGGGPGGGGGAGGEG